MWEMKIFGVTIYNILNWFFIYSFLGWVWESCYVSVKEKRWVNRGFVTGPLCTIYGCGALAVYLALWRFEGNLAILFFGGMLLATVLEYFTAWAMETIFHASWWDYSQQRFNLKGRICLGASLGWGVFTVILFKVFQPVVVKIVGLYPQMAGCIGVIVVMVLHLADLITSGAAAFQLKEKLEHLDVVFDEFAEYIQQTKLYESTGDIRGRLQNLRDTYSPADFGRRQLKRFEVRQAVWNDYLEQHGFKEYKEEINERLSTLNEKLKVLYKDRSFQKQRMLNAYPHLKSLPRKAKEVAVNRLKRKKQSKKQ